MSDSSGRPVVIAPAAEHDSDALISLLNDAFSGYIGGDLHLDRAGFFRLVYRQQIDLSLSRVALGGERLLAFAGVSRRGWNDRLAIMGVHPDAAGRGIGTRLTAALVSEASARGDRSFELEVIEQNPAAVRVYQKAGFHSQQRLIEARRTADTPLAAEIGALEVVDVAEAACRIGACADPGIPWPLSGHTLATLGPPAGAWRLEDAWALGVVPDDPGSEARLLALAVPASARGRGQARHLLEALFAEHRGRDWHVPANCPERYLPFLQRFGFRRGRLSQFHMRRESS